MLNNLRTSFPTAERGARGALYSEAHIHPSGEQVFGALPPVAVDTTGALDRYGIDLYELHNSKISLDTKVD